MKGRKAPVTYRSPDDLKDNNAAEMDLPDRQYVLPSTAAISDVQIYGRNARMRAPFVVADVL